MAKDITDDIISVLENMREHSEYAYVSPENVEAFFAAPEIAAPPARPKREYAHEINIPEPSPAPAERNDSVREEIAVANLEPYKVPVCGLDELKKITDHCVRCQLGQSRTNGVFGDGNPSAELMFVGEGPGYDEDIQGLPFVGKAGQLLTKMIGAMQFSRNEVYIANIVKCRPPNNRNPLPEEAQACLPYLERQIELIKPKVIVVLGSVPLEYLMQTKGIMRNRGKWMDYRGIKVMPTYHPSYLLRYPAAKRETWEDLQQVMKVFGKTYVKQ